MAKKNFEDPCSRKEIAKLRDKNRRHRNIKEVRNGNHREQKISTDK